MWIMTNTGFVSAVQHRDNPDLLVVRARRRNHLTFLKAKIEKTPKGDYLYRCVVQKTKLADLIVGQIENIDYDNFKKSVKDDELHNAYLSVWGIFHRYQK